MNKALITLLIIINLPLFGALASILFGREGILGAIRYLFIPDIISLFRGELFDDFWSQLMLGLWLALCAAMVWGEYNFIAGNYPELFLQIETFWPSQ